MPRAFAVLQKGILHIAPRIIEHLPWDPKENSAPPCLDLGTAFNIAPGNGNPRPELLGLPSIPPGTKRERGAKAPLS